jgi:acyl dehydratase
MTSTAQAKQVQPGDTLPEFVRKTDFDTWNRYAAVNYEFVPIHMDDEAGRAAGYPSAFGMGSLLWAYIHNMLRDWMGEDGRIVRVECQFRSPNLRGTTVTVHGTVREVTHEDGEIKVEVDILVDDDQGNKLAPGTATVALAA